MICRMARVEVATGLFERKSLEKASILVAL